MCPQHLVQTQGILSDSGLGMYGTLGLLEPHAKHKSCLDELSDSQIEQNQVSGTPDLNLEQREHVMRFAPFLRRHQSVSQIQSDSTTSCFFSGRTPIHPFFAHFDPSLQFVLQHSEHSQYSSGLVPEQPRFVQSTSSYAITYLQIGHIQ